MNTREFIALLAALGSGAVIADKAQAEEVLDELLKNPAGEEVKETLTQERKGYLSLKHLFYPDGHQTGVSGRAEVDGLSFFLSGSEGARGSVGSNRVFATAGIKLPVLDNIDLTPVVWGEAKNSFGQTSLESSNRGGAGLEAHARVGNRLDLKAILLYGWGDYEIKNADGKEGILKADGGLRGLFHLGKGHYVGIYGKSGRLRYDYLGKIEQNEVKLKYFFMPKGLISFGIGAGNTAVAYNPGQDFSSAFVEGNLDLRLSRSLDSPRIRAYGRHYFDGERRLSAGPIPQNEVGVALVVPWGPSKKQPARKESTHYQGVFYKPRGLIGGK